MKLACLVSSLGLYFCASTEAVTTFSVGESSSRRKGPNEEYFQEELLFVLFRGRYGKLGALGLPEGRRNAFQSPSHEAAWDAAGREGGCVH